MEFAVMSENGGVICYCDSYDEAESISREYELVGRETYVEYVGVDLEEGDISYALEVRLERERWDF